MRIKIPKALFIIIFCSLLFRLICLNVVPTGVSNDELDYLINAKALFLMGSDISKTWNPLSFTTPTSSFPQAEIAPLLTFLFVGMLPLSLFTSKLVYAIFGVGTVLAIYFIAKRLFGEKEAFIVGLVASINPWLLFFSRTAYDTPLSIFGFVMSLYALLVAKGWRLLIAFPFLFIAFYGYIGSKLLYLPFILITVFYSWFVINKKKYTKQYLVLLFLCLLPVVYYMFILFHANGSRVNELSTPNMPAITEATNRERKLSISTPLTPILSNKVIVFAKYSIGKYANAFSPNFLFINGDSKFLFTVWEHGVFYYLDVIFLLIGICSLYMRNKRTWILLMGLIAITPIPSVVSNVGTSYAIRSQLMAPFFILLIGLGIFSFISFFSKKYKMAVIIFIFLVYFLQLLNFANIYLLRNPIYNSESFNFSTRVLSKYLTLQRGREIFVINGDPRTQLKSYLFYGNFYNKKTALSVVDMYKTKKYDINNVHFITCKEAAGLSPENLIIYESGSKCPNIPKQVPLLAITYLSDGGQIYTIANDSLCSQYSLSRYPYGIKLSDFNVEALSQQEFCEKFIIVF